MSASSSAVTADTSFQDHINTVIAELGDRDHWASLDRKDLLLLLYHGVCTYGVTNDESMVLLLMPVYNRGMEILDGTDRMELYKAVKCEVESFPVSLNAFLPFLLVETDGAIVSTATIDTAMIGRPYQDDSVSWPKELVSYIKRGSPANRGAVFGGLLLLGDRRVTALLNEVKWTLTPEEIKTTATRSSGYAYLAAFEFWLSWCEELMGLGLGETGTFGDCASALVLMAKNMQTQAFLDIKRNFGYLHVDENAEPAELLGELSVEQVGARYADRLYALEAREQAPKVISHVLLQYGLESRSAMGEGFVIN
jgi:hypothetical protein